MSDERSLRRPGFAAGTPIGLADGQAWHFPPPTGAELVFLDRLLAPAAPADAVAATLGLAASLLRRNYRLDAPALGRLLAFCPAEAASVAAWHAIRDLILDDRERTVGDWLTTAALLAGHPPATIARMDLRRLWDVATASVRCNRMVPASEFVGWVGRRRLGARPRVDF